MNNGTDDDKNAPIPTPEEPVIPSDDAEPTPPTDKMDYYELGAYIRDQFQAGTSLEEESLRIGRRSAARWWLAGQALQIVHDKEKKDQNWKVWCMNYSLNLDTCYQAIRLFQRSGSIEKVKELSITEARSYYQTNKARWKPPEVEPEGGQPVANATTTTGPIAATAEAAEPTTEGTTPTAAEAGDGPKGGTKGTELGILGRLREELEDLADVAAALAKPDATIKEADATLAIKRIDEVMVKLREAKKSLQKSANPKAKSTSRAKAKAKVGDDR
jgi:hypothetical protein